MTSRDVIQSVSRRKGEGLALLALFAIVMGTACDSNDGALGGEEDSSALADTSGGDVAAPLDSAAVDSLADSSEPGDAGADIETVAPRDTRSTADSALADSQGVDTAIPTDTVEDGAPPNDPWSTLSGQELRDALQTWTSASHTPLGYNGARDEMYAQGGIDDHGGRIEGIYTGRTVDTNGSRTPSGHCELADGTSTTCDFNTEHTWPKYYLRLFLSDGSVEYKAAEGDIHHLFPADSEVNTARWHFDFGETPCEQTHDCALDEGSILGLRPGSGGSSSCPRGNLELDKDCVIWVRADRRGDIARAQLYMAVRYGMPIPDDVEAWLQGWNESDPPDTRERARNDAIEAVQGNRNPFVDWPELATRISDF